MRPRAFLLSGACLPLLACQGSERLTGPRPPTTPLLKISDGARGGTLNFYFLPPIASGPTILHTFDAEATPVVEICELSGSAWTCCCTPRMTAYCCRKEVAEEVVKYVPLVPGVLSRGSTSQPNGPTELASANG